MKAYIIIEEAGEYFVSRLTANAQIDEAGPFATSREAWDEAERIAAPQGGIYTFLPALAFATMPHENRACWLVR